jgi:hypothetical protein
MPASNGTTILDRPTTRGNGRTASDPARGRGTTRKRTRNGAANPLPSPAPLWPAGWDVERALAAVEAARALLALPEAEREAKRATLREKAMAEKTEGEVLARVYRLNPGEKPAINLIVVRGLLAADTRPMALFLLGGSLTVLAREGHEADDLAVIEAGRCIFAEQLEEAAQ